MILLPTLWQTVKWKHILFWYVTLTLLFWFSYDLNNGPIALAILSQMVMTFFAVWLILMVWSKVIIGYYDSFPIIWMFSTVVKEVKVLEYQNSTQLIQMKYWCKENCSGKWRYCKHGHFVFRKAADAMGFKLRWM